MIAAAIAMPSVVLAQATPPPTGITVGDFWFRPSVEVRTRGEYYHRPVEIWPFTTPVLGSTLRPPPGLDTAQHHWVAHERARVGLQVERGPLAATVVIEDGRLAGTSEAALSSTKMHAAFVEVHTSDIAPSFARLGRQEVTLGDGRLIGVSDWSLTPRSLDALRARWVLHQIDVEGLAALLAPSGHLTSSYQGLAAPAEGTASGTGAQLYAISLAAHLDPLLQGELSALARVVRTPFPETLTPSDTLAWDGRIHGELLGLSYAAEGVYEAGRLTLLGGRRNLSAWALAARVSVATSWIYRPEFTLSGSYASGSDDGHESHRFDPILPDSRSGLGQMGLYAWSNLIEGALTTKLSFADNITSTIGYRHVRLADSRGAWFSAALLPVGQSTSNDASFLGHEIDVMATWAPFDALALSGGYGGFATGQGARAILGNEAKWLSAAFLQVRLAAP